MNVRKIIEKHLREVGADGLVNVDCDYDGCGCSIEELGVCEHINLEDCQPGVRVKCTSECEHEFVGSKCGPDDYHCEVEKFFPLTRWEKAHILRLYPASWTP